MASAVTKSLIKSFVKQYGFAIIDAIKNTGLFFPAVVAQLSVESTNGTSGLAVRANNFGGIKGDASNGILMDTTETNNNIPVKAYFKKYSDFSSFMRDYVANLQSDRYVQAGVFDATSPEEQITAMVNAGYSTKTPKAYLATGIQDRINATRDIYGIGKIEDESVAQTLAGVSQTDGAPVASDFWGMNVAEL